MTLWPFSREPARREKGHKGPYLLLSSIQVVAIGQRTLWSEWKENSNSYPPTLYLWSWTLWKKDQEKANLLNHTFINQNTCLNLEGFPIGPTQLKSVFTIQDTCPADVRKIIKSLPNKASFGSDEISYRLLKEAGPGVVGPLTALFNLSLHSNRVPDEWKEAIVLPDLQRRAVRPDKIHLIIGQHP